MLLSSVDLLEILKRPEGKPLFEESERMREIAMQDVLTATTRLADQK